MNVRWIKYKLKRWWKRFKCFISGGCQYHASNMKFHYYPPFGFNDGYYLVHNRCVKCGKAIDLKIDCEDIEHMVDFKRGKL